MKNINYYILFACFSLIAISCRKEKINVEQVQQISSYTDARLNRVMCIDNTCFACGGHRFETAEILQSDNGGNNWYIKTFPEAGKGLYGMDISSGGNIYISGFDGKLLISKDKGNSWAFKQIPYWWFYLSMACATDDVIMLVSTEAQNSSNIVRIDTTARILDTTYFNFGMNDIYMLKDNKNGYVAGYGVIMKTTNGGIDWVYQDVKNDNFTGIHCLDVNNVWTCGYGGSIFRTRNGGASWDKLRNGNNLLKKKYNLLNIYFKDQQTGWACGEKGLLIGTTDGGDTWKEFDNFTDNALRDITLAPDGSLLAVGDNGTLYKITL